MNPDDETQADLRVTRALFGDPDPTTDAASDDDGNTAATPSDEDSLEFVRALFN